MDRAGKLPKIQDEERESKYGYVYAVSGPGTVTLLLIWFTNLSLWEVLNTLITNNIDNGFIVPKLKSLSREETTFDPWVVLGYHCDEY